MEESLNESGGFIPRDNIRSVQSDIKARLDSYEVEISDTSFLETSNVCDSIKNRILNYEDEPHLTKSQNNKRRIFIASELFISICSVYENIVDYEFSKTIFGMVQWEKYKKLSREITQKIQLESKAEKHFAVEARNKLKEAEITNLGAEMVAEDAQQTEESSKRETEFVTRHEGESPPLGQQTVEITENGAPPSEINATVEHALSSIVENMTTMRDEPLIDASGQQFPFSNVTRQDLPVSDTVIESSIQEPEPQENLDKSLREILDILEDKDPRTEVGQIEQPRTLIESAVDIPTDQAVEERHSDNGNQADPSEESEKWSLPSLESTETTRKRRRHLIIDEETTIHNYAERAMRLNRNINAQRVEVFEGPPNMLQAFSVGHLFKTPAFKNSLFRDVRSSTLSTLYNGHLRTETRPVEPILSERRTVDRHREDISRARTNLDLTEDVGIRAGMHSAAEKSDFLAEVVPKRSRLEDLEITPLAIVPPNETLIGMPVSRIITSTIQPLDQAQMEKINNAPISPRIQQCQGQSIDPRTSPPWFLSTRENPPSAKYREFNYVYKNIQKYWLAFEEERMEKCVTLREFLSLESAEGVANFLTVLRIVDKMSIQRKLKLEYKDGDVFIRPFDSLYFSNGQLILQTP